MAKIHQTFVCQSCGAVYNRWRGRCEACNGWNTIVEETGAAGPQAGPVATRPSRARGRVFPLEGLTGEAKEAPRIPSGIGELDRVTGGGFVRGSVILLGGDPGIGKSTLLMQASAAMAAHRRARRLHLRRGGGGAGAPARRAPRPVLGRRWSSRPRPTSRTSSRRCRRARPPALAIIDSIQTMWTETVESAPGTVTQVRGSAQTLIRFAKTTGTAVILVGHVTKDGQIAGPRVVEHMVDAVASFEGDQGHHFRILRAVKNRFGPTDEIGVFEMTDMGLAEVPNPSALFLAGRDHAAPGTAVFAGMEGTRPLLVEIQALVAPSSLGMPRRAVVGWDPNRLSMVLAVLEAHGGIRLGTHDVYLNVAGGLRISEPAADLAVAAALVSSLSGAALPPETVYFGEIGLSGAIRPVAQAPAPAQGGAEARLRQGGDAAGARRDRRQRPSRRRPCATSPTSWRASPQRAAPGRLGQAPPHDR